MILKFYTFLTLILLLGCNAGYEKPVTYGELLFLAQDDGLSHVDELRLYENGIFKIDIPNVEANGDYTISGDTIFLEYYLYKESLHKAFFIDSSMVFELCLINNVWSVENRANTMMQIFFDKRE